VPPLLDLVSNLRATVLASLHSVLDCVEPSAHATFVPGSAGSRRTESSSRTTADMCAYCSKGKHAILSCWKLCKDIRSFKLSRPDPFVPGAIPSRYPQQLKPSHSTAVLSPLLVSPLFSKLSVLLLLCLVLISCSTLGPPMTW
jgi:hypothetical protein